MNDHTELQDQIAAAKAYEALHVPAVFQQWAPRILDAVPIELGSRVLDVACGTGVLAREAAMRVGQNGFVAGIDPGPGMLAVAEQLAPTIQWRQGLEEELIQRILVEAESALQAYVTEDGQVSFDSPAHIICGTRASQCS